MSPLNDLISSSRADLDDRFADAWDADRAVRLREGVLRRRDQRVRREQAFRRGLLIVGGAGLLVLALLRAASSAPAVPTSASVDGPAAEVLAARTLADAGYARD